MSRDASDPFADLLASNERYAQGFSMPELSGRAARHLAVVTCIDSRIEPLRMLGLAPGDAKIIRNAGARITEDVLRSLVLATNFLDVTRILVVGHTDCAAAGTSNEVHRSRISELYPEVDLGDRRFGGSTDPWTAMEDDLALILDEPLIPEGVEVRSVCYDVHTGRIATDRDDLSAARRHAATHD